MSTTLEYLMTLTPEQMKEAVHALPKDEQLRLVHLICGKVQEVAEHFVENADEIWETKEVPAVEQICMHEPGKFMHPGQGKHTDVYECSKCGTSFTKKFYV